MRDFLGRIVVLIEASISLVLLLPFSLANEAGAKVFKENKYRSNRAKNVFAILFFSIWARLGYLLVVGISYLAFIVAFYFIFNLPIPDFISSFFTDIGFISGVEKEVVETTKDVAEGSSWWKFFISPLIVLVLGVVFMATSDPNDGLAAFIILSFTFIFVFLISAFIGILRLIF